MFTTRTWPELEVADTPLNLLIFWVIQVAIHNLTAEAGASTYANVKYRYAADMACVL